MKIDHGCGIAPPAKRVANQHTPNANKRAEIIRLLHSLDEPDKFLVFEDERRTLREICVVVRTIAFSLNMKIITRQNPDAKTVHVWRNFND